MRASDLEYELPEELIAQRPLAERSASRLMVVDQNGSHVADAVRSLPALLPPSLFVVNETRVIPARLFGKKSTGGRCELLLIEPIPNEAQDRRGVEAAANAGLEARGDRAIETTQQEGTPEANRPTCAAPARWRCLGNANKPLKAGVKLEFDEVHALIEKRNPGGVLEVRFEIDREGFEHFLGTHGQMPLPPYIARDAQLEDQERYQTVFAATPGAAAAPTAGLHFDEALLSALADAGHKLARVCLHVGPGTFRPVQSERLEDHQMHEERYSVPAETAEMINKAKAAKVPIVAVGTTVVRTLESAHVDGRVMAGEGKTSLFITPGFEPRVVDHLFTNFHLPRSTLLALVMAFGGEDTIRAAYRHAVDERFRFFSYGDAMLIRGQV